MTTIKEIAQKSGYSSATVSRLLNNDPNLSITADTKNKILEIANKLGYWKDHQEKEIKPTIALLYRTNHKEQLQDEYFTSLKQALVETVKQESMKMKTFYNAADLIENASLFQGFIGVGAAPIENAELVKLHEVLPNGVFVDTNPAPELFDSIRPNLTLTVKNAIDLFIKNGYESIGFIGGVGVATSVETAALLSKKALMRPLGSHNDNERAASMEKLLEDGINEIGLGPQGIGGKYSVMGVHIENTARHPSAIGVAVNVGCWSHRRGHIIFDKDLNYTITTHSGVTL